MEAEERVITELKELGKPFLVLLNSAYPTSERAQAIRADIASRYDVTCVCADCLELDERAVTSIIKGVLYEFPVKELDLFLPPWVDALPYDHPIKSGLYAAIREGAAGMRRIRDVEHAVTAIGACDSVSSASISSISLGEGIAAARLELPLGLFYETLSDQSGFTVHDDGDLMGLLTELSRVKCEYDKVSGALEEVKNTGYGIVVPSTDELVLEEPEIVKQGGRYGVRLKASAPSIHMIRADIETEVSPIVGNEKQSEEMINYLLQEFEGDTKAIWQSNIFGKSFHELVSEDLNTKLKRMPDDARAKLQETLQRIINEGSGAGLSADHSLKKRYHGGGNDIVGTDTWALYEKSQNAQTADSFFAIQRKKFLKYTTYSCKFFTCLAEKSLAVGHSANVQTRPRQRQTQISAAGHNAKTLYPAAFCLKMEMNWNNREVMPDVMSDRNRRYP